MISTSPSFTVSILAPTGASPDGTIIKNVGEKATAADGGVWIVIGNSNPDIVGQIGLTRSGVQKASSVNFLEISHSGQVYVQDQDPGGQPYWLNYVNGSLVRGTAP